MATRSAKTMVEGPIFSKMKAIQFLNILNYKMFLNALSKHNLRVLQTKQNNKKALVLAIKKKFFIMVNHQMKGK